MRRTAEPPNRHRAQDNPKRGSARSAVVGERIAEAYDGLANTEETLILMNHYPLENAGWAGRLQSDNADIVEAMAKLNG
ncbi:hypothetical protein ACFXJ8_19080 [Nonomuraea sp. NPDC059194]|uniref:hypothetical protein n=1 Tax=Nonomuraea sp. NPDC059194 TaxID=3346764 RepID=UPI0036945D9E